MPGVTFLFIYPDQCFASKSIVSIVQDEAAHASSNARVILCALGI